MWGRNDFEDGYDTFKTGSSSSSTGWVTSCDSTWQPTSSAPGNSNRGRRHSTASDSGDTGIGTSCSDSVEDHSSSSTTPSFQPLRPGGGIPTAHVMPSPSPSSISKVSGPSPGGGGSPWGSSSQLPSPCPLDMKDSNPAVRRWSSLTRLSAPPDKPCPSRSAYRGDPHGSLDRGLLYGYRQEPLGSAAEPYLPASQGLLLRSPGADPRYRYDPARCGAPLLKPSSLDLGYSALPESRAPGVGGAGGLGLPGQRGLPLGHQAPGGSPIQPAVRTQMWLSEQMEYRPSPELCTTAAARPGPEMGGGLSAWQQEQQHRERLRQESELSQMLAAASLPVNTLVNMKELLLRQREMDRQKQLHARIRENDLRVQQVLHNQRGRCEDSYILKTTKDSPLYDSPLTPPPPVSGMPLCCEGGELSRKLAAAELEVIHLNEFLKQNTQKYGEDIRKLEEKMKTRDRYISSLKKKCQRENEQNQEKQQRIETLEKYLADLPSLDQVQTQATQLEETQQKAQCLQEQAGQLETSLEEGRSMLREKEELIESQAHREKELMAAVHSLQAKVEQCLEDGVRLPMVDLKQLEVDNSRLLEEQENSSMLIANQKKQIEKLTLELMTAERRCQQERGVSQELQSQLQEKEEDINSLSRTLQQNHRQLGEGVLVRPLAQGQVSEAGPLLREMSLCLVDLRALYSILTQRAQGKEPNLALLLGIKSMSVSGEENDNVLLDDGLRTKLSEVAQLRQDIDALRTAISDRYAQDMGDNCVTQ